LDALEIISDTSSFATGLVDDARRDHNQLLRELENHNFDKDKVLKYFKENGQPPPLEEIDLSESLDCDDVWRILEGFVVSLHGVLNPVGFLPEVMESTTGYCPPVWGLLLALA
jgi:hypothetical protein